MSFFGIICEGFCCTTAHLLISIAAGVPLMCDEGDDYRSFRIGLFGLDKLHHVDRTVANLAQALDRIEAA